MILHDDSFDAPASSVEALRGLRSASEPRWLWIDAICINQTDIAERGHQVSIMAYVYSAADQTNIYIPMPNHDASRAVETMMALQNLLAEAMMDTNTTVEDVVEHIPDRALPDLTIIQTILFQPWFARLWVYQEVMLSAICICYIGAYQIDFAAIQIAGEILRVLLTTQRSATADPERLMKSLTLPVYTRIRGKPSLLDLCNATRHLQTTDRKDKIYGLLGLKEVSEQEHVTRFSLEPDYALTDAECFRDATRYMISEGGTLNHIFDIDQNRPEDRKEWPSWIYDGSFSRAVDARFFNLSCHADNNVGAIIVERGEVQGNSLYVGGLSAECLENTMPLHHEDAEDPMEQLLRVNYHRKSQSWPLSAWLEAAIATGGLTGGTEEGLEAMKLHLDFAESCRTSSRDDLHSLYEHKQMAEIIAIARADLMHGFKYLSRNQRCFWTRSHMGIGPSKMREGDLLTILFGCSFPVVLRPNNGWYQLIGPAYVHGIMHGEFVRQKQKQQEHEILELR